MPRYQVGDRVAQIHFDFTANNLEFKAVRELDKTERGEGGYGSTNKQLETFYIDTGSSTLYFQTTENTVTIKDRTITLSRHSFLLFLATAKELGFKTGKI